MAWLTESGFIRRALLWALLLFAFAFAIAIDLPGILQREWLFWDYNRETERLLRRADYLQDFYGKAIDPSRSDLDAASLSEELRKISGKDKNPFGREYGLATYEEELVVIEKPRHEDSRVCMLRPDGSVLFIPCQSEVVGDASWLDAGRSLTATAEQSPDGAPE